ncbi:homocysteine S-methyltransferase family protein [Clostridium sp. MD294]|uniref:homocysteine S-methyltransferase family protein n=1 Tax=Clostridium sp. MD294 TaxID=97138 RepID=UPI0002C93DA3|nr:homocysteine S-methyltransferase family protein [Clostridium sp. MD294]USF29287.1 Methionine synthase [Clostridium sp. MD294]
MSILELLKNRIIFFDGGTGTLLQEKGLQAGELPELWNIEKKQALIDIHKNYFEAGSDIVLTNTFGANCIKLQDIPYTIEQIITAAVENAKQAAKQVCHNKKGYVALDIGPTGKLLQPLGDLTFEAAYEAFQQMAVAGEKAGADIIVIETMSDIYETKAAVLAAKENTNLPVFVTVVFDEKGKLLTGSDIACVVSVLEGLGVDAIGMNCGLGPHQMLSLAEQMLYYSSIPVIVKPNAGLPRSENGKTVFDVTPEEFAKEMVKIVDKGACIVGGCCGTTPAHINSLYQLCKDKKPLPIVPKNKTLAASYTNAVEIGKIPVVVGERINPTGKSRFKQALREKDFDYILREGFSQQQKGAHILDVNVGLPDIDETDMLVTVIKQLQSVIDLPLQIDTSNIVAMEKALRIYNGKAVINSVNGKKESMEAVFPLVKKYGGVVIGLTLDENGIPATAEERFEIAKKIVTTAESYGISSKDIMIDVLAMTISSDQHSALETLKALNMVKQKLNVKTVLGVSNISFGLPQREIITANFYTMALQNGLDAGIINTNSDMIMQSYYAYKALAGLDDNCMDYISQYGGQAPTIKTAANTSSDDISLGTAIEKGLKERAKQAAEQKLENTEPLTIINEELIPALDHVGKGFEKGTVFLPQLLMSAEAAKFAFEAIKLHMNKSGVVQNKKDKIILATVKGDIHDIGKNIVKVLLENYSYDVVDLGKDVPPEKIVETAISQNIKLVGLSALMTTTVTNMEETIKQLKQKKPDCKIVVGGAVLTQEYADSIGADHYAKDAMATVYYAQKILG